ncbi:prolyl oligopeptidase family serine peptidase [Marivirga sp. S37H4]|uniref:Prolyl oligopeptidase family serine peptidase n=2 Tax=Marivirga aurantiaca TaxID=2802615 RepID=A0A935CDV0_9BACT|nr:prolyl oligopeptidase family serine peptidase [Marivirga aurantiaca]
MRFILKNPIIMRLSLLMLFSLFITAGLFAQTSELSVQKIMQDPKSWVGTSPSDPFWAEDGQILYFKWNPEAHPGDSLYKVNAKGGEPVKVSLEEELALPSGSGDYNNDKSLKVFSRYGDIFLYNIKTSEMQQLTQTLGTESSPSFTGDEKYITYEYEDNLYRISLMNGAIEQLTDFQEKKSSGTDKKSEQDDWLEKDNVNLIKVLQERKSRAEQEEAYQQYKKVKRPKTYYLNGQSVGSIELSPNQDYITFTLFKRANNKSTIVPDYLHESGYTEDIRARSKVGSDISDMTVGIYHLESDSIYFLQTNELEGIDEQPAYLKEYNLEENKSSREVITNSPVWSDDGRYLVANVRSKDNKDRWICLVNPVTAELEVLDRQRDEAWIGGPGIGWTFGGSVLGFMPDNKSIYFQSEETGYSHLYTIDLGNKRKKALTKGNYEVYDPRISADKKFWYFEANPEHPGIRNVYYMPINGGKLTAITTQKGKSEAIFSPDDSKIALLHSTSNQPTELFIKDNPLKAETVEERQITQSTTEAFDKYPWREAEVITFKARDGEKVHSRIYKPEAAKSNGAAVVFVHGAGYLQNAHHWWSSYFREYMFHNLLTDLGYTVLDIDYRGSAGYGRDWRTAIYRHMGGKDLTDQVDGAKYLVEEHGIDAERIGMYGGSYGGFITLMAMFTTPDVFAAGAALRSVTDWAHYNHGYTSNILNVPVADSIAYRKSSPIYYAEGLQGALLICHGMVDDNVHFQDVVRLAQRLIELGKENWEMAVYPVERHGFVEPSSWTDEYRRILKLFEDNLRD